MFSRVVKLAFETEEAVRTFDQLLDAAVGIPPEAGYTAGVVAEAAIAALAGEHRGRFPAEEFEGRTWRVGNRTLNGEHLRAVWNALPVLACGARGHLRLLAVLGVENISDRYARKALELLRSRGLVVHHGRLLGWSRSTRDIQDLLAL